MMEEIDIGMNELFDFVPNHFSGTAMQLEIFRGVFFMITYTLAVLQKVGAPCAHLTFVNMEKYDWSKELLHMFAYKHVHLHPWVHWIVAWRFDSIFPGFATTTWIGPTTEPPSQRI